MFESKIAELFSKKILSSLDVDFDRALLSIYHIWPEMDMEGTQSMLKLDSITHVGRTKHKRVWSTVPAMKTVCSLWSRQLKGTGHFGTPGRRALKHKVRTSIWSVLCETSPNTLCYFILCPDFWLSLGLHLWSPSPTLLGQDRRQESKKKHGPKGNVGIRMRLISGGKNAFFLIKMQIIQVEHMVEKARTQVDIPDVPKLCISGLWVFGISISDH